VRTMYAGEHSQIGNAMWCICGEAVYVTTREVGYEPKTVFLNFKGDELSQCPKCGMKWTEPGDLEYSEPHPTPLPSTHNNA